MKSFADWIVGSVVRAGLVAAALTWLPLFGFIGSAALVLASLKRGAMFGLTAAAVAAAVLLAIGLATGQGPTTAIGAVLLFWAPALALAEMLRRFGRLGPSVSFAAFASLGVVLLWFGVVNPADGGLSSAFVEEMAPLLQEGMIEGVSNEDLLIMLAEILPGLLAASLFLIALLGLLTGMWWHASISSPGALGDAFRSLRLGSLLGLIAAATIVGVAVSDNLLFRNLAVVLVAVYVCQGLAVLHSIARVRQWPSVALAAVYVFLIFGMGFMAPALAMAGLADTWANFRGRDPNAT